MVLFIIGVSFSLGLVTEQPVLAQAPQAVPGFLSENNMPTPTYNCLHTLSMRFPHCRGKLIWLFLKRWLETHIHWDTARWGMPVYIEFDDNDHWQQVSLLCVHFIRSSS